MILIDTSNLFNFKINLFHKSISHPSTRTQTEQLERLKIEYFLFRVIFLWEVDATQSWPAISHTFDLMDSPGPFSIRRDAGETPPPPLSPLLFFPFFVPRIICPLSRLFGNNGDTLLQLGEEKSSRVIVTLEFNGLDFDLHATPSAFATNSTEQKFVSLLLYLLYCRLLLRLLFYLKKKKKEKD